INADVEQLTGVFEIGPKIAASIVAYFSDTDNLEMINRLKIAGIRFRNENENENRKTGNALNGKIIVISGIFSKHSREEYKEMIEKNGGRNSTSVSGITSFILAGENMGQSKKEKAEELKIPLMSESDFLKEIGEE
ncbi:MAG TPA: BRCT domain-containing protein, partial [Bacteroidales bacterium]